MRLVSLTCLVLSALTASLATAANSAEPPPPPLASGAQIRQAVAGNTVEGSMDASGRYTEFYAADGSVRAKGYKARWSIEGDSMCWVYEGQPKDCWQAALKGGQIRWIKGGKVLGSGTVVKGNPNKL